MSLQKRLIFSTMLLLTCMSACSSSTDEPASDASPDGQLSVNELLSGSNTTGFSRAIAPRTFEFPRDHGPHPEFRTEWWYLTGNLVSSDGRRFGYQFTLFRNALSPAPPARESAWATRDVYMAHFAVTDVRGDRLLYFERFAREGIGLAGVESEPWRAWIEDWSLHTAPDGTFRMEAGEGDVDMQLQLGPGKPIVLQGNSGLSRKGSDEGNASYYYSLTRMPTSGHLVLGDRRFSVSGTSWMDREWSTSALERGQVGWDWFALQLDDGRDLMVYQMRRADGTIDPTSHGCLVAADGTSRTLEVTQFRVLPIAWWQSPVSGARYPAGWRVEVPDEGLGLKVTPLVADQEMRLSVRYWEGAVAITGHSLAGSVSGRGYVELTGYDGASPRTASVP